MECQWRLSGFVLLISIAFGFGSFCYVFYPPQPSSQLTQWKESGKYFTYNKSFDIFYKDEEGSGSNQEILVVIHGFPTFSYDYVKVWDAFKKTFSRVITLDFIGFGFSAKPVQYNYTIVDQANLLEALLQQLKASQVHLFSHDFGDSIVQELMHRFNHKNLSFDVKTVVMTNGGIIPELLQLTLAQKLMLIPFFRPFVPFVMNYCVYSYGLTRVFGNETQPTHQELTDWWLGQKYNDGPKVIAKINLYQEERKVHRDRWIAALQEMEPPFHYIFGKRDPLVPDNFTETFRNFFPKATIDVLDVGHYVASEAPQETTQSFQRFYQNNNI